MAVESVVSIDTLCCYGNPHSVEGHGPPVTHFTEGWYGNILNMFVLKMLRWRHEHTRYPVLPIIFIICKFSGFM